MTNRWLPFILPPADYHADSKLVPGSCLLHSPAGRVEPKRGEGDRAEPSLTLDPPASGRLKSLAYNDLKLHEFQA